MFSDSKKPSDRAKSILQTSDARQGRDNISQLTHQMETDELESPGDAFTATREGFAGLYHSLLEAGQKPESNDVLHPPGHPDVDLMPNGDVFGSYGDLDAYLTSQSLSARRGQEVMTFEKHHLIEDHWMQSFGFSRREAPCVVIYENEHMQLAHGKEGIAAELPRGVTLGNGERVPGVLYDIDTLVEGHTKVYREIGRSEWAEHLRGYVHDNRDRILQAYQDGTVVWATPKDIARIRKYLQSL